MTEFNVGDTVRLTKGKTRIEGVVTVPVESALNYHYVGESERAVESLLRDGFCLLIIERAVVLPVEPGWYQSEKFPISSAGSAPYHLGSNGIWYLDGMSVPESEIQLNAPYAKIGTVRDTAKRVLDRLAEIDKSGGAMTCSFTAGHIKQLSKEFGVASE